MKALLVARERDVDDKDREIKRLRLENERLRSDAVIVVATEDSVHGRTLNTSTEGPYAGVEDQPPPASSEPMEDLTMDSVHRRTHNTSTEGPGAEVEDRPPPASSPAPIGGLVV